MLRGVIDTTPTVACVQLHIITGISNDYGIVQYNACLSSKIIVLHNINAIYVINEVKRPICSSRRPGQESNVIELNCKGLNQASQR